MNKRSEGQQIAVWAEQRVIVAAIRAALPSVLHYASFGSHVQKKLAAALPGYNVRCFCQHTTYKIDVWSCSANGLSYDDSPYIAWNVPSSDKHWSDGIHYALDRADPSDSLERYDAEEAIIATLTDLDNAIRACKETAERAIASLPIPLTAIKTGMRVEPQHWSDLSHIRRDKFPNLFPGRRL